MGNPQSGNEGHLRDQTEYFLSLSSLCLLIHLNGVQMGIGYDNKGLEERHEHS